MYFNVNFNVFFKIKKVHLLVSELYIYQNARCNNKKNDIGPFGLIQGREFVAHLKKS